jgi:signal transduction histidine kinase
VLASLLDHIFDNAREASGDLGEVTLALNQEGEKALLRVGDNGAGMTRRFIETELFKPFASTKDKGFGIGMYQCRDIVERWRGRLLVDSEPGQGTAVTITLPLAAPPPGMAAAAGRDGQAEADMTAQTGDAETLVPKSSAALHRPGERAA